MAYDPQIVAKVAATPELERRRPASGIGVGASTRWDRDLLREPRVLRADRRAGLVVPRRRRPRDRWACAWSGRCHPAGAARRRRRAGARTGPSPFAPRTPRAPGVHLHWALPDALLRGDAARSRARRGAAAERPAARRRARTGRRCPTAGRCCAWWRRETGASARRRCAAGCSTPARARPGRSPPGPATAAGPAPARSPAAGRPAARG